MDLLLSRYSNIEYLMGLDSVLGMGMIVEALRQKDRDEKYMLYCSVYPNFTEETFIPFERFYTDSMANRSMTRGRNSVGKQRHVHKGNKDEIMNNVSNIMKDYKIEKEVR